MQRKVLVMQHHPRCSHNATVISLSHPILLCIVGWCKLLLNSLFCTKKFKFFWHVFTSIIALERLHLLANFFLNQCLESYKLGECLIFLPPEEDPTLPCEVINKNYKIFVPGSGGYRERCIKIIVGPFKGYMCFFVSIMECGYCVLSQRRSFAYIPLLKCSFREACVYLLHDIHGAMMQMAKSFVPKFTDIAALDFLRLCA